MWKMVSAILIKKSMLMVGFLTHNDSDILRAKTGPYRCIRYQTNIPPTPSYSRTHPLVSSCSSWKPAWEAEYTVKFWARYVGYRAPGEESICFRTCGEWTTKKAKANGKLMAWLMIKLSLRHLINGIEELRGQGGMQEIWVIASTYTNI